MQKQTDTLGNLLAALQNTHDLGALSPRDVSALLEEARNAVTVFEEKNGHAPAQAAPMALAVRNIAAQDASGSILVYCLRFWLSMPVACWNHAIQHLETAPQFNLCEPGLNSLPLYCKLLLVHEVLRNGIGTETQLGRWTQAFLDRSENWPFHEILQFMNTLYTAKRVLNLQMAERLAHLKIPQQCIALVESPVSDEMAKLAATALCIMEQPPSTATFTAITPRTGTAHIILLMQALRTNPPSPLPNPLLKALVKLACHEEPKVRKDALFTMVVLNVPNLINIFLLVMRKFTRDRNQFYPALLFLSPEQFSEFLSLMPPKLKQDALGYLLHLFMEGAADLVSHSLTSAAHLLKGLPADTAAELKRFVLSCHKKRYVEPLPSSVRPQRKPGGTANTRKREEATLFGKKKTTPEELFAKTISTPSAKTANNNFSGMRQLGQTIAGIEFPDTDFSGSVFESCIFEQCTFRRCDLSQSAFTDCTFLNCRFEQCTAGQILLDNCTISGCTLADTDASEADIYRSTFTRVLADRLILSSAHFHSSACNETRLSESVLWETSFTRAQIHASHFSLCDFTRATFFGSTLRGCTFRESTFNHNIFERTKAEHTFSWAGNYYGCIFRQTLCDEPHLLMSGEHRRFNDLMELAGTLPPAAVPRWCRTVEPLAEHVINTILQFRSVLRSRYHFLRRNNQRIDLTCSVLETQRAEFFLLLPLLLESRLFEKQFFPNYRWPVCTISGYAPTLETLRIARSLFCEQQAAPGQQTDPDALSQLLADQPAPTVTVDAIYTIGSVGSVAMTGDSDIDYWVSIDPATCTPDAIRMLGTKLDHISRWAQETFGLETTFFVMNREAVIRNDFGISDKESSGSAQALLLKEEFYRTALKVCGRDLAWWAMPSGAGTELHAHRLRELTTLPFHSGDCFVDFGLVKAIPDEEYFGAALWQIVKAFKNPFKSVMKLGILEAYLSTPEKPLLCEEIKQHVVHGSRRLLKTDPYVTLMRALQEHYHASGNKEAAALLQTAFMAKLHPAGQGKAAENKLLQTLRTRAVNELYGSGALVGQQDFEKARELGDKLNTFFLKSYASLQQKLEARQIVARISPEDITRLGRKIFATFAPQQDKIGRLPFVNSMGRTIRELFFKKDSTPGRKKKWIAMGLPQGVASRREAFVEVRAENDPVCLMAWLVANGLYSPDMHVEVDMTLSPIAAQDVTSLLQGLYEFFPKSVLETEAEETLQSEKIFKGYLVPNFALPRDTSTCKQLSVVYVTNWGEMFCSTLDIADSVQLAKSSRAYLARELPRKLTMETELICLIPYKSRTPRISTA
ncbi:class I adenylate cyclase [Desulfovibrio subterraneus]|uniref:class I adenylate cyclase n=1 Tax=Desulfovibrio subterraneus TaxID=2718620 RepID=UPI0022B8C1C9|nr:class I adenylate cyclase [Desulfovibrio subterraneus]WBF67595.1 class I adenylate cyclase [Desulfovibrio subterraneus]